MDSSLSRPHCLEILVSNQIHKIWGLTTFSSTHMRLREELTTSNQKRHRARKDTGSIGARTPAEISEAIPATNEDSLQDNSLTAIHQLIQLTRPAPLKTVLKQRTI
jgi:hypothetical protein